MIWPELAQAKVEEFDLDKYYWYQAERLKGIYPISSELYKLLEMPKKRRQCASRNA